MDGFVKVNWDVVLDKYKIKMGIYVIIIDGMDTVLATLSQPKDYIITPDIVEATAAQMVALFNRELRFYKVVLEGDIFQIVQALKYDERNRIKYGHLIEDTQEILNGMQKQQVNHVKRSLNGAAHQFAKKVLSLCEEQCFLEKVSYVLIANIIFVLKWLYI